jgi:hypothetical protein
VAPADPSWLRRILRRFAEVLIGHLRVVGPSDGLRISEPRGDDVRGKVIFQFGLLRKSQRMPQARPRRHASSRLMARSNGMRRKRLSGVATLVGRTARRRQRKGRAVYYARQAVCLYVP